MRLDGGLRVQSGSIGQGDSVAWVGVARCDLGKRLVAELKEHLA